MFLGLGFSFFTDGGVMFSPGDLTSQSQTGVTLRGFSSHADFETECERCHAPLETTQADLCIRCHTTVVEQLQDDSGTHAGLPDVEGCRVCHPDHQGKDFDPTRAAFKLYDHSMTRFSLRWHQFDYDMVFLDCYACHLTENEFELIPLVCQSCHTSDDPSFIENHLVEFGEDCLACHDGTDQMTNFDHTTTSLPLDGIHAEISCGMCHLEGRFDGTPGECASCHLEPPVHAGLFSGDCAACHTIEGWSILVGLNGASFDHLSQTGFSMNRHITDYAGAPIQCADCHASEDGFKVEFEMDFCIQCHTIQDSAFMAEHDVQFGLECLSCHDGVDRLENFDHNQTFVLDGEHAEILCESCHSDKIFRGTPRGCVDCHVEPEIHAGYFGLQCENCHSTAAWAPAKMQSHSFPLDHGEEGLVTCEVCHTTRYTEYTCYGCHEHQPGEILEKHQDDGITGSRFEDCMTCHPNGLEDESD
jgi:hypothetical protein